MHHHSVARYWGTLTLALIAFAGQLANADVKIYSTMNNNAGGALIGYDSTTGTTGTNQSGLGAYNLSPGGQLGHQVVSTFAFVSGTADQSGAEAHVPSGLVRAYSENAQGHGTASGGSRAHILDTVTFNNPTGQPANVTISWSVHGSLAASGPEQGLARATYSTEFRLEGDSISGQFSGQAQIQNDPQHNYHEASVSGGWQSSTVTPPNGGYSGVAFTGVFTIPTGESTFSVSGLLDANSAGNQPASANFAATGALKMIVPQSVTFTSQSGKLLTTVEAFSRKTHGAAGTFDIPLPLSGTTGVECRNSANGAYQIVVRFANPLSSIGAVEVSSGPGGVQASNVSGGEVTIDVTGLTNQQTTVITLNDVQNGAVSGDIAVPISLLIGDSNGDRGVNVGDAQQVRNRSGQDASATNFRSDVNADGTVNAGDATAVRNRSGTGLP